MVWNQLANGSGGGGVQGSYLEDKVGTVYEYSRSNKCRCPQLPKSALVILKVFFLLHVFDLKFDINVQNSQL